MLSSGRVINPQMCITEGLNAIKDNKVKRWGVKKEKREEETETTQERI